MTIWGWAILVSAVGFGLKRPAKGGRAFWWALAVVAAAVLYAAVRQHTY